MLIFVADYQSRLLHIIQIILNSSLLRFSASHIASPGYSHSIRSWEQRFGEKALCIKCEHDQKNHLKINIYGTILQDHKTIGCEVPRFQSTEHGASEQHVQNVNVQTKVYILRKHAEASNAGTYAMERIKNRRKKKERVKR